MASLLQKDGIWTWWNKNVTKGGNAIYVGSWGNSGLQKPIITKFDAVTRSEISGTVPVPRATNYEVDDHDDPGLCYLASGRILACWSYHNGDSFCCTSLNADDPTSW